MLKPLFFSVIAETLLGFVKGFVWLNHNNRTFLLLLLVSDFVNDRELSDKIE